jgi:hypothetical protein
MSGVMQDTLDFNAMDSKRSRKRRNREFNDSMDEVTYFLSNYEGPLFRKPKLWRMRWNEDYFVQLAINESSFVAEYRMSFRAHKLLCDMLEGDLKVDQRMAGLSTTSGI